MRVNINDWEEYHEETVGKQEKTWLIHNNKLFLFKKATIRPQDGTSVFNDISECMASDIAKLLKIECADYFLCERNQEPGVITPSFHENEIGKIKREELISGVDLIYHVDPDFKNTWLENPKTHDLYTISLILKAVEQYQLTIPALEMIIYDLLIGNFDRNPSNWGIIKNLETGQIRFAPLFDNCTSLGVALSDKKMEPLVIDIDGKPTVVNVEFFQTVIHEHIISKIVIEPHFQMDIRQKWYKLQKEQNQPNKAYNFRIMKYQPMFEYLTTFYPNEISSIMDRMSEYINNQSIDMIMNKYSDELDAPRLALAKAIVLERANWMVDYYQREKQNSEGRLLI